MTKERGIDNINMNRRNFVKLGTGLVAGLAEGAVIGPSPTATAIAQTTAGQGTSPLRLELKDKFLRLGAGWCEIPDWTMGLEVGNELLQTTAANAKLISEEPFQVEFHFLHRQLIWEVRGETDPATNTLLLRSTIHNQSNQAMTLGKAFLLRTQGLTGFFKPGDDVVYLPMLVGQALNPVRRLDADPAKSDIAIQAFNQTATRALQVGFVTFQRAVTKVAHDARKASGIQLKAWCDFDGWELPPETSTPTETLIVAVGGNPHTQLEAWADRAALLSRPRPRQWEEPPHGWLGWSWVDMFNVDRQEEVVLRNARALRKRLAGFGLDYIWVSIGNIKDGQPGDWLNWNEKNFPSGHDYLREQLDQLGLKWGLWCGAFMLSSRLDDKVREFGEALFKQSNGDAPWVYMPNWVLGLGSPPLYALDPTHPKTLEFLREVFQQYRQWGVRYYMVDFLFAASDTLTRRESDITPDVVPHRKHYDRTLVSGPEAFRKGLQAIRDACGDDTHLLASTGPTIHTAGILDAVRTGNDFCEGRPLVPDDGTYPGTFGINLPTFRYGPHRALMNQAAAYFTHRKLYINNSGNVLTIDEPVPLNHAQMFATIHALSGGPTMLGDDITYMGEERLSLIKKTLPRPSDVAFPVDLFKKREQEYPRVFHRKIIRPWGRHDVVAVYNLEPARSIEQGVDLAWLGLDASRTYHVWDFWNSEYVGRTGQQLHVQVPPYNVKVYRLTEDMGRPTILGTNMHVLMGEVEIEFCEWDPTRRVLSGRALRPAGESGSVFIYAPPKMAVANPKGYFIALDARDSSLVIRSPLQFEKGLANWSVEFRDL